VPEIPLAGFVLEALGAVALALILSSFERKRPGAGVRDWALGLWLLAAGLLASLAIRGVPHSPLRTLLLALAMVLAYWSPALVLVGTYCRWNDREVPWARQRLLLALALLAVCTTVGAPLAGAWAPMVRAGTRTLLTGAAYLSGGILLLRAQGARPIFGARVLALALLGLSAEEGLFFAMVASGRGPRAMQPSPDVLIEAELVLLMLAGVGMIAWLLEEEREQAIRLQEALHRQEALSAMGTLVGGVAHEVRNPLFGITATVDALGARLKDDSAATPLVEAMREQVQRLTRLMTDLLDYGRPIAEERTRLSICAVTTRAIEACAALSRQAGVSVELTCEATSVVVLVDEPRLVQVFQNLVQNAVEHTPPGGRVHVEARPERRLARAGVRCAVRDSGPGFDTAHLPHVFEPFFTRRKGGTGLGLSIVQRIVEQHAGHVEAANHPGGGGAVDVWLPAAPAPYLRG
jgi:signal transduction histidine kinase